MVTALVTDIRRSHRPCEKMCRNLNTIIMCYLIQSVKYTFFDSHKMKSWQHPHRDLKTHEIMLCRVCYLSVVQVNFHLPVTICQKSGKLRVKNKGEAVTIGT